MEKMLILLTMLCVGDECQYFAEVAPYKTVMLGARNPVETLMSQCEAKRDELRQKFAATIPDGPNFRWSVDCTEQVKISAKVPR